MPTARYGDEARQVAIRSEGGAVQASNPGPAKLPGDTGTAAAALTAPGTAAARVPSATADGAGYAAAVAARIPPSRAVSDERAPVRAPHRRATFMATSARTSSAGLRTMSQGHHQT